MRLYSVIGYTELNHMVKVLKPRYNVPSRVHFSRSFVPALNKHAQAAVNELSTGQILHMEHY